MAGLDDLYSDLNAGGTGGKPAVPADIYADLAGDAGSPTEVKPAEASSNAFAGFPHSVRGFLLGERNPDGSVPDVQPGLRDAATFGKAVASGAISGTKKAALLGGEIAHSLGLTDAAGVDRAREASQGYDAAVQAQLGNGTAAQAGGMVGTGLAVAPYSGGIVGAAAGAPTLANAGYIANRLIPAAVEGGGINTLVGAGNGNSNLQNFAQGAVIGPLATVAQGAGKYIGNATRAVSNLLTDNGTSRLALNALHGFTGGQVDADVTQIVPGSLPTLAEAVPGGNVGAARVQKALQNANPQIAQQFSERSTANMAARQQAFDGAAGTALDRETAGLTRDEVAHDQLPKVFAEKQPVDLQPVRDTISGILGSTEGKRPAVSSTLGKVSELISSVTAKDGTADPEVLYDSVRKGLGDLMDKTDMSNRAGVQATRQILQVQDALDQAIGQGSNGFDKYLSDYSQAATTHDAMEKLQGLNLFDARGNTTLNRVQGAINNILQQQGKRGANSAKAVTEDQLTVLRSIRADLLRADQSNIGKAAGSDTVQNLASDHLMGSLLPGHIASIAGGHISPEALGVASGGYLFGPIGGSIGLAAGRLTTAALRSKNAAVQNRLAQFALNPEDYLSARLAAEKGAAGRPNALLNLAKPYIPGGSVVLGNRLLMSSQPSEQAR